MPRILRKLHEYIILNSRTPCEFRSSCGQGFLCHRCDTGGNINDLKFVNDTRIVPQPGSDHLHICVDN